MHETFPAPHSEQPHLYEQSVTVPEAEAEFDGQEDEPETWKTWTVGRFHVAASSGMKTGMVIQTGGREAGGEFTVSASFSPQDIKDLFDLLNMPEHREAFEAGAAEGLAPPVERGMHVKQKRGEPIPRNLHATQSPESASGDDATT